MIQRLVPIIIFAALAIAVIQLVNYSFNKTYASVKSYVETPYQEAQKTYEATVNEQ